MDNFYEQLVIRQKAGKYKVVNIFTYFLGALAFLMVSTSLLAVSVAFLLAAVALFFIKGKFYDEYEYDITNDEIDVDIIYEKKKRKRLLTFSAKDIELLAQESSSYVKEFSGKPEKVMVAYPNDSEAVVYVAMITGGANRLQLKFVPNEEFIQHVYKYNPRAVKRS